MAVRGVRAPLSFLTYGFVFTDVGMAYEIFSLRFLREVVNDNILPLQAFANGSRRPPIAGSLLIWQKGGEFKHTGHVAVITQLVGNKVRIAEQNVIHSPLPQGQQWTRELTLEVKNGLYTIKDTFADTEILGWMIQTADTEHSLPQPVLPGEAMAIKGARLPNKGQYRGNWLNEKDSLQKPMWKPTATSSIKTLTSISPSAKAPSRSLSRPPTSFT